MKTPERESHNILLRTARCARRTENEDRRRRRRRRRRGCRLAPDRYSDRAPRKSGAYNIKTPTPHSVRRSFHNSVIRSPVTVLPPLPLIALSARSFGGVGCTHKCVCVRASVQKRAGKYCVQTRNITQSGGPGPTADPKSPRRKHARLDSRAINR